MAGFVGFLVFFALILAGGYLLARREARSTPARRMMFDAGQVWNRATPRERTAILAQAGILEGAPNFTAYLVSTWAQLDLNVAALIAAVIEAGRGGS